ncbi:MAG: dTDP-4-dehydrorhamnose reductase [Bacteroidales bacterium]
MGLLPNSTILITGSHGQLGSELAQLLKDEVAEERLLLTNRDQLDITSWEEVDSFFSGKKIDIVINCAAYNYVERAQQEPQPALAVNRDGAANLAKAAERSGALLLHFSTDYVFDGTASTPYSEESSPNPLSIYGKSKELGERALLQSKACHIIIRTSWLYSQHGSNFVKSIIRAASNNPKIEVVFDQIGTPTYAADLAQMVVRLCKSYLSTPEEKRELLYGIYHYSNEGVASWYDFAQQIVTSLGIKCKVLPVRSFQYPSKVERPNYSVLDKSKIKSLINIEIPHWRESLELCLKELSKGE